MNPKPLKNIFSWYYAQGLEEILEIGKNLLHFFWRYFSIGELFRSLFSPWKRDITFKYWRGFHPLKSLSILIENAISRIVGAVVRSAVIITGFLVISLFFLSCLSIIIIWLFPPAILAFVFLKDILGIFAPFCGLVVFIFYLAALFITYSGSRQPDYWQMEIKDLSRFKWFHRVWGRLGIAENEADPGIFENSEKFRSFLKSLNLAVSDFEKILDWEIRFQQEKEKRDKFWLRENLEKIAPVGRHWRYAYTARLDRYALDLSHNDPTGYRDDDFVGREGEASLLKLVLSRPEQNSVLLVGGSGSGRTTLVHNLARLIRLNRSENFLKRKRILVVDLGNLISEAASEGKDIENILRLMFQEAAYAGNVILVVQNIENYLGSEKNVLRPDIAPVINEYLPLATFQIIATSTPGEYHRLVEKHEELMKYFEVIELKEATPDDTLKVLLKKFLPYEKERVVFTYQALNKIISSSSQYQWSVPLPERALDLAEEVLLYWRENAQDFFITPEAVDKFLTLKTGSPHGEIQNEEERERLLNFEKILHRRIIGQEEAVKGIAEALRRVRSGINDPKKPVGSFLFLGPTGVGKTETAKALAEGYFGDEEKMIRFDMSEYQNPLSVARLIGSETMNQPGLMTTKVKDNPYSLILLDEIEKAYPDILNLFLQVLDEGFITDAFGEKINFRSTIIIATSNAGAPLVKKMVEEGLQSEEARKKLVDYIVENNIFRPEFLNRFDGVVFFRPLTENEMLSVASLMLGKITRRLAGEKNIEISFGEGVAQKIIEKGYNPVFGARSVQRYIEDKLDSIVAKKIISGEAQKGEEIFISADEL